MYLDIVQLQYLVRCYLLVMMVRLLSLSLSGRSVDGGQALEDASL